MVWNHISARLPSGGFLVTPGDRLFDEVTHVNLTKSSPSNVNVTADVIHAAIYDARTRTRTRGMASTPDDLNQPLLCALHCSPALFESLVRAGPDVRAIVHHHTPSVVAVSCMEGGLQYLTQDASAFVDRVAYHDWEGVSDDYDEKSRLAAALGPKAHTLLMRHHGAVTCGQSVAEAWVRYYYLERICAVQCAAASKPCRQPSPAVLAHSFTQLGPDGPFAHGKFEWAALLRLSAQLQAARTRGPELGMHGPKLAAKLAPPRTEAPTSLTASALRSLEIDGFCILRGVIPAAEVGAVRESVMRTTVVHRNPNAPPTIGHVPGLLLHDQSFAPYLSSPTMLDVVESIFGGDSKITFTTGQTNYPGCERQEWHSDWPFNQTGSAHIRAPYADATCHLTALFMLDAMTEENGTILLPGSHKAPTNPSVPGVHDPNTPHPREQRATGAAGSVLIIDSRLWHCIPPNPTNTPRVAFAVRYAPWWLDTSVVMPGSAARHRIVDGAGRPQDVGGSHAGIPLGNPSQPPIPPAIYARLPKETAALYEHWLPPAAVPPAAVPPKPSSNGTVDAHGSPNVHGAGKNVHGTAKNGASILPPLASSMAGLNPGFANTGRPSRVLEIVHALNEPHAPLDAGEANSTEVNSTEVKRNGYCVLKSARPGNGHAPLCPEPFTMASVAALGFLDAPSVLALTKGVLGDFYRICDVQSLPTTGAMADGLTCAWPHNPTLTPCVSAPPLARLHAQATRVLHVHFASNSCTILVHPFNHAVTGEPVSLKLARGDAIVLDSRVPFRWQGGGNGGKAVRVSYSPWFFDGSILAEGSIHRRRVLTASAAGLCPPPPAPRPALSLAEIVTTSYQRRTDNATTLDLLQHWEVESIGYPLIETYAFADEMLVPLEACPRDLLAAYGRIWALQQMLQSGLFDLAARGLGALGPTGMGQRSFMAAKVRSDARAAFLLPLFVGAAWQPSVGLLFTAHLANVYLHASRAPFIWDHELWDMLTELIVMIPMGAYLISHQLGAAAPDENAARNGIVAQSAPAVRTAMIIFYAAAAFWKLNSSFFDPHASCAPVFVLQLVGSYLPDAMAPAALTDILAWTAPLLATLVEVAIPTMLAQASKPMVRMAGLALGLLFHFLIALTPPPNNAGGFSVGAIVRYFFFMPRATAAAIAARPQSPNLPSQPRKLVDTRRAGLVGAIIGAVGFAGSQGQITLQGSLPVFIVLLIIYVRALLLGVGSLSKEAAAPVARPTAMTAAEPTLIGKSVRVGTGVMLALSAFYAFGLPVLGLQDSTIRCSSNPCLITRAASEGPMFELS